MRDGDTFNPYRLFTGIFIPHALARCADLSPGAKLIYGRLCRFAGEKGECFPAVETLGSEVGISERQARRYLSELEAFRLIRRTQRGSISSLYQFLWHPIFDGRAEGTDVSGLGGTDVSVEESHIEESHLRTAAAPLAGLEEWPWTAKAVARYFEAEGTLSVRKFIEDSVSEMINRSYIPDEKTDYHLAGLVKDAVEANPKARWPMFKQNVVTIIKNRLAQHG